MTEYHFNAEDLIVFCPMKLKANILYTMLADPVVVFLSVEEKRRLYLTSGGYFRTLGLFWVGVCCRDPGILSLYQSYFK